MYDLKTLENVLKIFKKCNVNKFKSKMLNTILKKLYDIFQNIFVSMDVLVSYPLS